MKVLCDALHYTFDEEACVSTLDLKKTVANLIANGVTIPPCKVGDAVYIIDSEDEGCVPYVLSVMVTAIGYDIEGFWITMCLPLGFKMSPHCGERCFGKTVFLTKEEAVRALKERES